MSSGPRANHAVWLWALSGLFFLRVLGQVLVEFAGAGYLPPSAEWYSGLMPYPILLPVQVIILAAMVYINIGISRGTLFIRSRPTLSKVLLYGSILYVGLMVVRYLVSGSLHPERRFWPPGSLPIVFHFVLAGYLYTLGRLAEGQTSDRTATGSE